MVAQAPIRTYRSATYGPPPRRFAAEDMESVSPAGVASPAYPYLRSVLAPEYADLPSEQLAALMESQYGLGAAELYDEYFEGFFGDVGRFVSKAAPVVTNIAGGVVRGATSGASLGLPGIIGGAVAGGVGQGFASYGSGSLRNIGKGINTGIGTVGQFSGTGRIGGALGGAISGIGQGKNVLRTAVGAASSLAGGALGGPLGAGSRPLLGGLLNPAQIARLTGGQGGAAGALSGLTSLLGAPGGSAASQLMGLLQRPEVLQSLGAMALGPAGRRTVPVGSAQTPVPVSAFANLLGMLANRAADEQAELSDGSESDLRYLTDDTGEWLADPAESEQRAALLYELLNVAEYERLLQDDQQLQLQQAQQQRQLRTHAAFQDQQRRALAQQRELQRESALYDALELAEVAWLSDDSGELDEFDEFSEFDEFDEFNEFDEFDDV